MTQNSIPVSNYGFKWAPEKPRLEPRPIAQAGIALRRPNLYIENSVLIGETVMTSLVSGAQHVVSVLPDAK